MARKGIFKERVHLGERSYDIVIGEGLVGEKAGKLLAEHGRRAMIVSNRRVFGLYGSLLADGLEKAGVKWEKVLLPEGERYKTVETVMKVHDGLIGGKYDRDALVIALGGGVIGDIAGFAAATYMRGVRVAQVPTTLLSQVDSSVGGKTGVNHPKGKNMIGAFHQPSLVIADVGTLATLPRKEILGGVAEVIKYGLIASKGFFNHLERNIEELISLKPSEVAKSVRESCRIKAEVVAGDERESGRRAILNYGHTIGHAVEALAGYGKHIHGFAVAMGMASAAALSMMKGTLSQRDFERITGLIKRAGLPVKIPAGLSEAKLWEAMERDKKVKAGTVRFVLLNGIGECSVRADVTRRETEAAIRMLLDL